MFVIDSKLGLRPGFLMRLKKSEFRMKRNLFEKAFVYQQGNGAIEHKISQFCDNNEPFNAKNTAITGDFSSR